MNLWLKLRCGTLVRQDDLDVFWSATGISPALPRSLPICVTVHDLNVLVAPETMSRYGRIAHQLFFEHDLRAAKGIIAVSRGTAARLQEHYGLATDAISPNGVGSVFYPRPEDEIAACLKKYSLRRPFCLAVGTLEPRKNIMNLLKAFDIMDGRNALHGHRLVHVGRIGWQSEDVLREMTRYEDKWLDRLDYIPDEDLACLYSAASLFVFPSTYEGFGIPMVEARACGAPVAVTDIPELREYCGPDAILIPGTTPDVIAEALQPALARPPIRASVSHTELPTWEDAAQVVAQTLVCYARQS